MKKKTLISLVLNLVLLSGFILTGCASAPQQEEERSYKIPDTVTEEMALGRRVCHEVPSDFYPYTEFVCEGEKRVVLK